MKNLSVALLTSCFLSFNIHSVLSLPNPNRRCPNNINSQLSTQLPSGTPRIDTTLRGDFTLSALGTQRTIAGAGTLEVAPVEGNLDFSIPQGSEVCKALLYWSGRNISIAQELAVNGFSARLYDINENEIFYKTLVADVTTLAQRNSSIPVQTIDPAFTETLGFGLLVIYGSRSEPLTRITAIDNAFMGYENCTHQRSVSYLNPHTLGFLVPEGDSTGAIGERLLLNSRLVADNPFTGSSRNGFGYEAVSYDVNGYAPGESHRAFLENPEPLDPAVCVLSTR